VGGLSSWNSVQHKAMAFHAYSRCFAGHISQFHLSFDGVSSISMVSQKACLRDKCCAFWSRIWSGSNNCNDPSNAFAIGSAKDHAHQGWNRHCCTFIFLFSDKRTPGHRLNCYSQYVCTVQQEILDGPDILEHCRLSMFLQFRVPCTVFLSSDFCQTKRSKLERHSIGPSHNHAQYLLRNRTLVYWLCR